MKNIIYVVALLALTIVGCSKDEDAEITIDYRGIFVSDYGETGYTTFTSYNVSEFEVTSYPDGWDVSISTRDRTITATAPSASDSTAETWGLVYITATSPEGDTDYTSFSVGITERIALDDPQDDQQANCMIVTKPNTLYTFNPNRRGESTTEVSEKAVSCEVLWRTADSPITYVRMEDDGSASFYTRPDTDESDLTLVEGNAVIVALDKSDNILWGWHIWITENPVTDVEVAGMTFLDRNLGAFMNANTSEDDIMDSYGLYYQWGRRDPFIYPDTYNASGSEDPYLYDNDGASVEFEYETTTSKYGTLQYALENPMIFLTGDADSQYDWLYGSNQDDSLWGSNGEKTIYDPSPKGYRVPTSAEYELLQIDESENETLNLESYGRNLSGVLFMAYGLRTYLDYAIQNYMSDGSYAMWAGYYWSCNTNGDDAEALYFDLKGVKEVTTSHRATGMQIRSIKME